MNKLIISLLVLVALICPMSLYYGVTDTIVSRHTYVVHVANFIPASAFADPALAPMPVYEEWVEYIDRRDPENWIIWNALASGEVRRKQIWHPIVENSNVGRWDHDVFRPSNTNLQKLQSDFDEVRKFYDRQNRFNPFIRKTQLYPYSLSDFALTDA